MVRIVASLLFHAHVGWRPQPVEIVVESGDLIEHVLQLMHIAADATEQHDDSMADRSEHRFCTGNTKLARRLNMQLTYHTIFGIQRKASRA